MEQLNGMINTVFRKLIDLSAKKWANYCLIEMVNCKKRGFPISICRPLHLQTFHKYC